MKNSLRSGAILLFLLCTIVNFTNASPSFAYLVRDEGGGAGGHHEQITEYSIDSLDYGDAALQKALNDNKKDITDGVAAEDNKPLWLYHFYDPSVPYPFSGLFNTPFSADWRAGALYEEAKKTKSWEKLGHALHLLQDMASPSHVYGASHWQHNKLWKNGYEWWVTANWVREDPADTSFKILSLFLFLIMNKCNIA